MDVGIPQVVPDIYPKKEPTSTVYIGILTAAQMSCVHEGFKLSMVGRL